MKNLIVPTIRREELNTLLHSATTVKQVMKTLLTKNQQNEFIGHRMTF
jgi:ribosomal protein L17